MREDMDRVVIERPRHGSDRCYREVRRSENWGDLEMLPTKQGMRRPYRSRYIDKEFSDLLSPLVGYLRKQVGRPWDDVYSEIRERVNPSSTTHIHIVDHVMQIVEINVERREDGKLYSKGRWYRSQVSDTLYVDPDSKLLCWAPHPGRTDWGAIRKAEARREYRYFGHEKEAFRIDGIWYWAVYSAVPEAMYTYERQRDGTLKRQEFIRMARPVLVIPKYAETQASNREVRYGSGGRYRSGKTQMSHADLRRLGLENEYKQTYRGRRG